MIAAILFWISIFGLGYIFVFYPLIIHSLAKTAKKTSTENDPKDAQAHFDVLICSHREGARVQKKADEVWMAGATLGLRRIVLVLDGHDPEAEEALKTWIPFGGELKIFDGKGDLPDYGVVVMVNEHRAGKSACLNSGMDHCTSDWVVMMDVRQKLGPHFFKALKKRFSDPAVNVISGNLVFTDSKGGAAAPVGAYWKYEKWIRQNESRLGCVPGATGAGYALRRSAFVPVPEHLVLDDVFIPMAACRSEGKCVFELEAVMYDAPSSDMKQERLRKRRTIGGNFQLFAARPLWGFPGGHPFWFSYLSHKLLRLKGPGFLLLAFFANLFLLNCLFYQILFGAQIALYLMAMTSEGLRKLPVVGPLSQVVRSFVSLNFVVPVGFWMWVRGDIKPVWVRAYVQKEEE